MEKGEGELHRDSSATAVTRFRKKLMAKSNWFKQKKDGNENINEIEKRDHRRKLKPSTVKDKDPPATVIFVPRTPGG